MHERVVSAWTYSLSMGLDLLPLFAVLYQPERELHSARWLVCMAYGCPFHNYTAMSMVILATAGVEDKNGLLLALKWQLASGVPALRAPA